MRTKTPERTRAARFASSARARVMAFADIRALRGVHIRAAPDAIRRTSPHHGDAALRFVRESPWGGRVSLSYDASPTRDECVAVRFWPRGLESVRVYHVDDRFERLVVCAEAEVYDMDLPEQKEGVPEDELVALDQVMCATITQLDLDAGYCFTITQGSKVVSMEYYAFRRVYTSPAHIRDPGHGQWTGTHISFTIASSSGAPCGFDLVNEDEVARGWRLVCLRELALLGRAMPTESAGPLAWLMTTAPLWVLVHVCRLLCEPGLRAGWGYGAWTRRARHIEE